MVRLQKLEVYDFLIGCLITVFHFSEATFLASDMNMKHLEVVTDDAFIAG